jgi:hypothetical protein
MLEGVLLDETRKMLLEFIGHFGRSSWAWAIVQAPRALGSKALYPFAQSGIGQVEGRGDGGEVLTRDHGTDGLRAAEDPRLLGLLEHGVEGRQRRIGKVAFEGAHGFAPGERKIVVSHMTFSV